MVFVDGEVVGGMTEFHDNDRLHFALPLYERDPDELMCVNFNLAIQMVEHPEQITWDLTNETSGDIVLKGGPYAKPHAMYREFACLPDGTYMFTIYDSAGTETSATSAVSRIHF